MSAIGQVIRIVADVIHHICVQHMQLPWNFTKIIIIHLQCNYYATIVTISC
jgi:hypothetical protein